jgi:hypothetical protein
MMRTKLLPLLGLTLATSCTVVQPAPPAVAVPSAAAAPQQSCREYTASALVNGVEQQTVGTACLQPDGRWKIVDSDTDQAAAAPPQVAAVPVAPPYPYYYPAYPYYYPYPYPAYWGPSVGFGFRFGGRFRH